jgi:4-hydroxybenzoate polyprenyltransferase
MLTALLRSMRPRQWAKNTFIFAPLVFDQKLTQLDALLPTLAGFVLLCTASSAVYLVNDLADIDADRKHPSKRFRPIAAGTLPQGVAKVSAVLLFALTLGFSLLLSWAFTLIVATYIVTNLLYSFWLKHVPIIDVLILASGYVLRVAAGVVLISVERFSPWLYICTTLLALFIGFGKRRAEMVLLADGANEHRRVLDGYTLPFLDQLIVIVSACAIMAYSLYTFSAENLPDNHFMMLTIPFVMYGIFRYLQLIHVQSAGGAPDELVLSDRPLLLTILLWGLSAAAILYFGS